MRNTLLISLLCISVTLLFSGAAMAFHDEGVAYCGGCHTMHNSQNGNLVDPNSPNGNPWLLKDATPSDVCLSCHAQSSSSSLRGRDVLSLNPLSPNPEAGGGDYVHQLEDNLNDGYNGGSPANWIPGYKGGHSLNAPSKGLGTDPVLSSAPGGTFPASQLGCSSCHDPHGNEEFRLLHGIGEVQDGLFTFTNPAPEAVGIALISGSGGTESQTNHTAYQSGMSEWCANCHGNFHSFGTQYKHTSGTALTGGTIQTYNVYNGTGDQLGGNANTAYLPPVPFEDLAMTVSSTAGPTSGSVVTCVTCHRAHATSGPDAGRWDFNISYLEEDGVNSGSFPIPNPYASQTAEQRSLCNKCHNKDEGDALNP